MKTPTISELDNSPEYRKVMTLRYDDIAPFIVSRFFSRNYTVISFWALVFVTIIVNVLLWIRMRALGSHPSTMVGFIAGYILIPITLAPLHELIHWVALKMTGAKDIRIGMNLSQGIIYISPHYHVMARKPFSLVAASPFIIITTICVILICLSPSAWMRWLVSSVLFVHTTMCIGDIVLTGYMFDISHKDSFTWDDVESKESYFYALTE